MSVKTSLWIKLIFLNQLVDICCNCFNHKLASVWSEKTRLCILCLFITQVSDFWDLLLKVDQTEQQNTLVVNQQWEVCPPMMGERERWKTVERERWLRGQGCSECHYRKTLNNNPGFYFPKSSNCTGLYLRQAFII